MSTMRIGEPISFKYKGGSVKGTIEAKGKSGILVTLLKPYISKVGRTYSGSIVYFERKLIIIKT